MAIERRNPLPAGDYWLDLFKFEQDDQWARFDRWLSENRGKAGIITVEDNDDAEPPHRWVKFRVKGPELPPQPGLGFPTIITQDKPINTSDDTVQKPDVEDLDAGPAEKAAWAAFIGGGLVLTTILAVSIASVVKAGKAAKD